MKCIDCGLEAELGDMCIDCETKHLLQGDEKI